MIIVKLFGGLGNQMFQYATGRALAARRDTVLKLDLGWFRKPDAETPRGYELDCFSLTCDIADETDLARVTDVKEAGYSFDPSLLRLPDDVHLEGYWQTERYFAEASALLRHDFQYASAPTAPNAALLEEIEGLMAVSLHVRRGDFVAGPIASRFHGVPPPEYYRAAVDEIVKRFDEPHFFVFSDDPGWCKRNISTGRPTTFVDHNPADHGAEDMRLMRRCKHHITANSSFSWWGAWLGDNPERVVYAPRRWCITPEIDTRDVLPEGWHAL